MTDLEYLKLSKPAKMGYNLLQFFKLLPKRIWGGIVGLAMAVMNLVKKFGAEIMDIVNTFIHGDWKTKVSFFVMRIPLGIELYVCIRFFR